MTVIISRPGPHFQHHVSVIRCVSGVCPLSRFWRSSECSQSKRSIIVGGRRCQRGNIHLDAAREENSPKLNLIIFSSVGVGLKFGIARIQSQELVQTTWCDTAGMFRWLRSLQVFLCCFKCFIIYLKDSIGNPNSSIETSLGSWSFRSARN